MNEQNQFGLKQKKKRALWKDALLFAGSVGFFWGAAHVGLNYSAYAEITAFKFNNLKASVVSLADNFGTSESAEPLTLEKIKTDRQLFRNKDLKPKNQAKQTFAKMDIYPSDNRIYIPRIQKNVPLVNVPHHKNWQQLESNIQEGLRNGAVVHPVSHAPGTNGNFFVTGHSSYYPWDPGRYKDMFALLHEVHEGEIIHVFWEGRKYVYRIKAKEVVPPTATEVLDQPENLSIITLMTCTPVGTNKNRLILIGELVKEKV